MFVTIELQFYTDDKQNEVRTLVDGVLNSCRYIQKANLHFVEEGKK